MTGTRTAPAVLEKTLLVLEKTPVDEGGVLEKTPVDEGGQAPGAPVPAAGEASC